MPKEYQLPWGREGRLTVRLPDAWNVIAVAEPEKVPGAKDVQAELHEALASPIGAKPLRTLASSTASVCIVVDDITRPTPAWLLLPGIMKTLSDSGVKQENISIVFAVGLHRAMTEDEMGEKVGRDIMKGVRCINHNCYDTTSLTHLGRTSRGTEVRVNTTVVRADLRILVGIVEPHVQAGFGGGFKNILPGVAGAETIGHNHYLGASDKYFSMIGWEPEDNLMRMDIEETGRMLPGSTCIVNTVLNPEMEVVRIVAGDPVLAHREGLKTARRIYGVRIPKRADIVLTDSFPMDTGFRQDVKSVANTLFAAKEGGTIMALWRCRKAFDGMKVSIPRVIPPLGMVSRVLRVLGSRGIKFVTEKFLSRKLPEDKFFTYFALQALRRNAFLVYSPTLYAELGPLARSFPLFNDLDTMIEKAHEKHTRADVVIFPRGGVTYPVLEEK